MKKFTLFAALAFLGGSLAFAGEGISAPGGDVSNPINADYGGVELFSVPFSAVVSTVGLPGLGAQFPLGTYGNMASTTTQNTKTKWRIYGAYFSSGTTADFIDVFQSTGGFATAISTGSLRLYNVAGSTGGVGASASGFTPLRWPIRMLGSIFVKPSNNGYNTQGIMYWKEPD